MKPSTESLPVVNLRDSRYSTCTPGTAGNICLASWDTSFQARAFKRMSFLLSSGTGTAAKMGADADGKLPNSAFIASTTTRSSLSLQVAAMSYHIVDCRKPRHQLQALAFKRTPLLLSLRTGASANRDADAGGTLTKSICIATTTTRFSLSLYTSTTACEIGHLPQSALDESERNHEGMDSRFTMLPHFIIHDTPTAYDQGCDVWQDRMPHTVTKKLSIGSRA